jgi:hypothetical protein
MSAATMHRQVTITAAGAAVTMSRHRGATIDTEATTATVTQEEGAMVRREAKGIRRRAAEGMRHRRYRVVRANQDQPTTEVNHRSRFAEYHTHFEGLVPSLPRWILGKVDLPTV